MSYENIEFAIDKGVAKLTLIRPDSLNSFTTAMHGEVREVLTQAAQDSSGNDEDDTSDDEAMAVAFARARISATGP